MITSTEYTQNYTCDGVTTVFSFPFSAYEESDITVSVEVGGVTTQLQAVSQFSVTMPVYQNGGAVTILDVSLAPAGSTLTIERQTPETQTSDYQNSQFLDQPQLMRDLDKIVMMVQEKTGAQGPQGNQGVQGTATGVLGPQGNVGAQGPQGQTGNQGTQGVTGSQGYQGNAGVQGPQGNQGPQGPQGYTGNQGFQGAQGTQGYQGAQGIQGYQGAQGTQGINGSQGGPGVQGPQGVQGYQGYQGALGNQGYQGNAGVAGPPGTGLTKIGVPWTTGQNWIVGDAPSYSGNVYCCIVAITGSTTNPASDTTHFVLLGAQGAQGTSGAQGATGPQGNVGSQGATGSQGNQGYQGSQGSTGVQGLTGSQGAIGPQGNTGSQGATGPQGNQGNQGYTGSQGVLGPQGVQGAAGPQGVIGPQGLTGSQGQPGPQGYAGSQGVNGSQGAQGTIGPEFTTEQYAVSTTSSPSLISIGQVTVGDRILVTGMFTAIWSGTPTNAYMEGDILIADSNNAVGMGLGLTGGATFLSSSSGQQRLETSMATYPGHLNSAGVTGVIIVNQSGTIAIQASVIVTGGTATSYNSGIYSVFYKKQ